VKKKSYIFTDDFKKKLEVQLTQGFRDEFYEVTKNFPGRFRCTLTSEIVRAIKPVKNESLSIDNKLSTNYLIDSLCNFQNRFVTNEYKRRKCKKKVMKLIDDHYEPITKKWNIMKKQMKKQM
jgi:DNA-binding transcriptional regulator GbsR (MarR family)